jgi:hypothetical protein
VDSSVIETQNGKRQLRSNAPGATGDSSSSLNGQ